MSENIREAIARILETPIVRTAHRVLRRSRTVIALALLASLLLAIPRQSEACGPFFTDAIFVYTKHPDFPLERFAQGQLGVLPPSYARSYLFVAYRHLIGVPLSAEAATAMKSLWADRLDNSWTPNDDAYIKKWVDARAKVPGIAAPGQIRAFRNREKPHEYETYLNCQEDAFENAGATLGARIARFGADSTQVRDWLGAQDTVFLNCGEGQHIPDPAPAGADTLIQADRAYQIAAAKFYAGSLDEAKEAFDAIARDSSSPWRDKAAYLAARALVRKAGLAEKPGDGDAALAEAETRLKAVLADRKFASMNHAANRLLNLVRLRLHPEQKVQELAHSLAAEDKSADFKQDVWDYTRLLDKFVGEDSEEATKKPAPPAVLGDELTDWILTFQDESPAALAHSIERWEHGHALPWLVAAMTKVSAHDAKLDAILVAAGRVDQGSPAFATLAFNRARLLIDAGRRDDARQMLDQIVANDRTRLPASAINLFLGQRMMLSRNLQEFLQNAPRVPAGFSDNDDGREIPEEESATRETTKGFKLFFDTDSANVFNKAASVDVLREAALSKTLPVNLRGDVAQAVFMRAALLDDRESAGKAAAVLAEIHPELRTLLAAYERAGTPDARRFAAAYLSLKFPGLRPYVTSGVARSTPLGQIDSYRDNWWCVDQPASASAAAAQGEDENAKPPKPVVPPAFMAASQALAAKQFATLQALGPGPNYLCRAAIDWANKNPADPRAPEALHLAVKATRFGCTDKETGRWSKAAFDLLHRRYANTAWAKETKYWFKD